MDASKPPASARPPLTFLGVALVIIPLNYGVLMFAGNNRSIGEPLLALFLLLAALQFGCGLAATVTGFKTAKSLRAAGRSDALIIVAAIVGVLAALGALAGGFLGWAAFHLH